MTATAKKKPKKPSRLMREMLETADGMHAAGIMDAATHRKIASQFFHHLPSNANNRFLRSRPQR